MAKNTILKAFLLSLMGLGVSYAQTYTVHLDSDILDSMNKKNPVSNLKQNIGGGWGWTSEGKFVLHDAYCPDDIYVNAHYMLGSTKNCKTSPSTNSCFVSKKSDNVETWDFGVLKNSSVTHYIASSAVMYFNRYSSNSNSTCKIQTTSDGKDHAYLTPSSTELEKIKKKTYAYPSDQEKWHVRFLLQGYDGGSIDNMVYWDYKVPSTGKIWQANYKHNTTTGSGQGENKNVELISDFLRGTDTFVLSAQFWAADTIEASLLVKNCRYASKSATQTTCTEAWSGLQRVYDVTLASSSHTKTYSGKWEIPKQFASFFTDMDSSVTLRFEMSTHTYNYSNNSSMSKKYDTTYTNSIEFLITHKVSVASSEYGTVSATTEGMTWRGENVGTGKTMTFKATPNAGYTFDHWEDGYGNKYNGNPFSTRIFSDLHVKPVFKKLAKSGNIWVTGYIHNGEDLGCTTSSYTTSCMGELDYFYGRDSYANMSLRSLFKASSSLNATLFVQADDGAKTKVDSKTVNATETGTSVSWTVLDKNSFLTAKNSVKWIVGYAYENSTDTSWSSLTFLKKYPITFAEENGEIISQTYVSYGETVSLQEVTVPVEDNIRYSGYWYNVNAEQVATEPYTVTDSAWFKKVLERSYKVTFTYWSTEGKSVSSEQFVKEHEAAVVPSSVSAEEGCVFEGWDKDFDDVTGVLDVSANYRELLKIEFTVNGLEAGKTFKDIKVNPPNNCFTVLSQSLMDAADTPVEGEMSYGTAYRLDVTVFINQRNCGSDELVQEWRNAEGKIAVYPVYMNGEVAIKNIVDNDVYDYSSFDMSYSFTTPEVFNYGALSVTVDKSGYKHAVIDGKYTGEGSVILEEDFDVGDVVLNRTFTPAAYSTIILPFDVDVRKLNGVDSVLAFDGMTVDADGKKAVRMECVWMAAYDNVELKANTPYLVKMNSDKLLIAGAVTIKRTIDQPLYKEVDGWQFRGTYSYKAWPENDGELGKVYGFAAGAAENVNIGDFVKVDVGAWIPPMRAYLIKVEEAATKGAPLPKKYEANATSSVEELPDRMAVVVVSRNDKGEEQTTVIGHINTRTGEIRLDGRAKRTFDLKGRSVNGNSKTKGMYLKK